MSRTDPPALNDCDLGLLLDGLPTARIAPERAGALWSRIAAATDPEMDAEPAFSIVHAARDDWRELLPGLRIKPLRVDPVAQTQTSLWKLEPGVAVPAHAHRAEEECLIIDGSLAWEGKTYGRGDYLLARAGGHHTDLVSPTGALFLIRGELNEPLRRLFAN